MHQRWLQRHRTVWTKEFSAALHLVKRKQVIWRFERLSRDLLLASRYGISWLFQQVLATSRGQLARGPLQDPLINCPNKVNQELGLRIVASKLYESVPLLERLRFDTASLNYSKLV